MNSTRSFAWSSALALAVALSLGGCKSSTPPPADQNAQQPAAAGQPASGQPATDQSSSAQPSNAPAAAGSSARSTAARTPAAPPPPAVVELPAGTNIRVRLDSDLGSQSSQPGQAFSATVAEDVMRDGQVIIPKESRADGTVIDAKPLGKFKGGALLSIRLDSVHTRWGTYPVQTSSISRAEKGKGKRSTGFIAGGAGLGALIGGLAGGGKGAAIGALAGGGAGTAGAAFTGNKQIVLPAETLLTFSLDHSVRITEQSQAAPGLQQR
ncbi:MAG TPA: hypothetical protein VN151_03985 [Terracidiphilus sp.]|nr:hypothetical protein [Terracidiphilus sp.]